MDAFTASLRADLVATNVKVTAIAPGAVATPEFGVVRFKGDKERAAGVYAGYEPLTGEDCADAVIYAVTRPPGCAVGEVVLWATRQATPHPVRPPRRVMREGGQGGRGRVVRAARSFPFPPLPLSLISSRLSLISSRAPTVTEPAQRIKRCVIV